MASTKRAFGVPLLLVAAFIAATSPASGQTTTTAPKRVVLRYAISGDENNITPFTTTNRSGKTQDILNLVYDTLLYSPNQENPEPWLAESVTNTPDNLTWTFKIRTGVTWHDGMPLTAEDVKFTFEYFAKNQQGRYSHHTNDLPTITKSELVDPNTVRFTCAAACPTFNVDPGADLPILPKHIWEKITEPAKATTDPTVGSGPYKVTERVSEQSYVLTANTSYFKGKPLVDEIQMPIIKESAAMFLALSAGQVDATSRVVPPESVSALQNSGLKIIEMADYGSVQINYNNQRAPFNQAKFRKALNLAADTDKVTQTLLLTKGKAGVDSFLDPDSPFANKALKHEFSQVKAKALLDELGIKDTNSDGLREFEGKNLDLEILVSSLEAREVRASELIVAQWKEVGVGARVNALDPVTVNTRRTPKDAAGKAVPLTTQTGDYDMYVTSYVGGHFHFDPDGLLYALHSPGKTGFGAFITGYSNTKFDDLVEQASRLGVQERKPLLLQAQQVLYDDPPALSLYFPDGTFAYRPQAYTGWIQEIGNGVFHKRSFLPGKRVEDAAAAAAADTTEGGGSGGGSALPFVLIGAVVVGGGVFMASKRKKSATGSRGGPEVD